MDAAIGLYAIPQAWLATSTGRWTSPARHEAPGGAQRRQIAEEVAAAEALAAMAPGSTPAWEPASEAGQQHASG